MMQIRSIWALALWVVLSGCSAKGKEIAVEAVDTSKPQGWQTECVGRWLVDVPAPIDLGASYFTTGSYPEFFDYTPATLRESTRSRGQVKLGPVGFSESVRLMGLAVPEVFVDSDPASRKTLNALQYTALMASEYAYRGLHRPDEGFRRLRSEDAFGAWVARGEFQVFMSLPEDSRGRFYWRDSSQIKVEPPLPDQRRDPPVFPVDEPLAREVLNKLVPRYTIRQPGHIPKAPGICTPHGFFADPADGTAQDSRVSVSFTDPRYANLALHVEIMTRMPHTETATIPTEDIRKAITPWGAAEEIARDHKARCRSQNTSSNSLFGPCAFAGATGIDSHWEVQYLKLANGQEARAMAITYPGSINEYKVYEAIVETAGKKGSVTEPRIVVTVEGFGRLSDEKAFRGKEPPPLQEAFKLAVTLAKSLRPRPQAIDPARPVVDPWTKFRQ
jgi:hypothetical protein